MDRLLRRVADRRRQQLEDLHAAAFQLLLHNTGEPAGAQIEGALSRLGAATGAKCVWIALDGGPHDFHCWAEAGKPPYEAASAMALRLTQRFSWDGNAMMVAPGGRAAVTWQTISARRRAVLLSTLLLRSGDESDVALMCVDAGNGHLRVHPETVQGLAAALLIVVQLDRRRALQSERIALESKLALGRRMGSVGALASGIAHNLNNILNAIDGFRATAALHSPPGIMAESLDGIGQAAARGAALVKDMLRFGRRVEGPSEPVDVQELLEETRKLLNASLPSTITLVGDDGSDRTLRVAGEFGQLQQVLLNLCSNAANAMPDGGVVVCRAVPRVLQDPLRLSHGVLRRGQYVTVVVSDEGRGIDEAAIPHLFDAFYTTRAAGSGLGLSTAREIVERHGGAFDVDSVIGVGSTFTVWLPIVDVPATELRQTRGAGEIVMLINPDPCRLSADEDLLAALGYEPLGILPDAGGSLERELGSADVVLIATLDPALAERLAREVRALGGAAPIIVAVPHPTGGEVTLGYPFRPAALANALARCLDRRAQTNITDVQAT